MKFLLVSSCLVLCVYSELTLLGPTLTPFGDWQPWQHCPPGTFVTAADVESERFQVDTRTRIRSTSTRYDDVGLVSVVLQCELPPDQREGQLPTFIFGNAPGIGHVQVGLKPEPRKIDPGTKQDIGPAKPEKNNDSKTEGREQHTFEFPLRNVCNGVAIGYQLMIQPEQLAVDNAGAVNLRLYCSELKTHSTNHFLEGYGEYKGEWVDEQLCRSRQAVCGIQILSQLVDRGHFDNTGINNVRLKCCDLPNPATTCTPSDEWQLVQDCNTQYSDAELPCSYMREVGVSITKADHFSELYDFNENNGFTLYEDGGEGEDPFWLQNGLSETFSAFNATHPDSKAEFNWATAGDETFRSPTSEVIDFTLATRKSAKIYQTVGKCSYFVARTSRFKIETRSYDEHGVAVSKDVVEVQV